MLLKCAILLVSLFLNIDIYQVEDLVEEKLMNTYWAYEKAVILGLPYNAEKSEQNDGLTLHQDRQFLQVEDGIKKLGKWTYDKQQKALILTLRKSGEKIYLYLEKLSEDKLIYRLEEPWKFDVYIHMKKSNFVKKQS